MDKDYLEILKEKDLVDKTNTIKHFEYALNSAGKHVKLSYNKDVETVTVKFNENYEKTVNVSMDSPLAMMKDILRQAF